MRELIHRYTLWLLAVGLLCIAVAVKAEPLPDNDEWHFFAIVNCGNAVLFTWYTPDGGKMVPVGRIDGQAMLDEILAAKEKAEADGNAYVVRVGEDCPRI